MLRRWPRVSLRCLLLMVALGCVTAGLRTRVVQRQRSAVKLVNELGGQLENAPLTLSTWLAGSGPVVEELSFLGPKLGDESIDGVVNAARVLEPKLITFMETRITPAGARRLRNELSQVEIEVFTPVLSPTDFNKRRY